MRSILVLGVLATLAGCFSPEPIDAASAEPAEPAAPVAASMAAAPGAEGAAPLVAATFPYAMEGRTGSSLCAPSGPNSCRGTSISGGENTFTELAYEGQPQAVDATLTWSAATPATERMHLAVFAARSCGDGCIEWGGDGFFEMVAGVSPLSLSASDVFLAEGETLMMSIGLDRSLPPTSPVYFFYSVEQAFAVEGSVVALVPATA